MEVISTEHMPYTIRRRDTAYYDKIKEQRLEKHFDSIQADSETDETLEITQSLESSLKNISTTIEMYKIMSRLDIRQPEYYKEYLERANAIITEALKDLE